MITLYLQYQDELGKHQWWSANLLHGPKINIE